MGPISAQFTCTINGFNEFQNSCLIDFCFHFITGESNVYTLGNIGAHRIVCTKLPTVGHTREAMTAAGNTTTRLLGKIRIKLIEAMNQPDHMMSVIAITVC